VSDTSIKVVGVGLIGTSLGLALARKDIVANLSDKSKVNLDLAITYGAGKNLDEEPELVVVCVPPKYTAQVVIEQLNQHPNALVTDVASVKSNILAEVIAGSPDNAARYLGSHPMAGREASGPIGARADIFFARPWVITPHDVTAQKHIDTLRHLAMQLDALPVVMSSVEHDQAVALVSHLPQLVSSALAARLVDGSKEMLNLSGQGLRDTTRIAASDPQMWLQILSQNDQKIKPLLGSLIQDLRQLEASFENLADQDSLAVVQDLMARGNSGVESIPGKHGGKYFEYEVVTALIDDSPGALASLLVFVGEIGVNLEDISLEHSPGAPIGIVEMQVLPEVATKLAEALTENGWRLA